MAQQCPSCVASFPGERTSLSVLGPLQQPGPGPAAEAPQRRARASQRPTTLPLLNSGQDSVGFLRKQSGLVFWGPQEGKSSGCEGPPAPRSPGLGGGSDLMRLVCGLSTLRLFKASLKISGCCYYTSEEEEMLAWRSQPGELLRSCCSRGWMGACTASERMGAQGRMVCRGSCGGRGGPRVDGREAAGSRCWQRCDVIWHWGYGGHMLMLSSHQARKPSAGKMLWEKGLYFPGNTFPPYIT